MMLVSGLLVFIANSPLAFGIAFFVHGLSLGIAYTGALYYGLQSSTNMGRSTGITESLVASAVILGWLILGEAMTVRKGIAVTLILIGIVMLTGESTPNRTAEQPQAAAH